MESDKRMTVYQLQCQRIMLVVDAKIGKVSSTADTHKNKNPFEVTLMNMNEWISTENEESQR